MLTTILVWTAAGVLLTGLALASAMNTYMLLEMLFGDEEE